MTKITYTFLVLSLILAMLPTPARADWMPKAPPHTPTIQPVREHKHKAPPAGCVRQGKYMVCYHLPKLP